MIVEKLFTFYELTDNINYESIGIQLIETHKTCLSPKIGERLFFIYILTYLNNTDIILFNLFFIKLICIVCISHKELKLQLL